MTLPDPGTDPVPDEPYRYPTLARWFGIDVHARQIADAITDNEALQEALTEARSADTSVDKIAPANLREFNERITKKGTKP